jgi:hypothetical protein
MQTIDNAAAALKVSPRSLRRAIRLGELRASRDETITDSALAEFRSSRAHAWAAFRDFQTQA